MVSLIVSSAAGSEKAFELPEGSTVIGRGEGNTVVVADSSVSTRHCELVVSDGQVEVRDLGSTNGTFVNGARIQSSPLSAGDALRVGSIEMRLQGERAAEAIPVPLNRIATAQTLAGQVCRNHPALPARWGCSKCGAEWCDRCVTDGRSLGAPGVKFCPACRSLANRLGGVKSVTGAAPRGGSFAAEMLAAWSYPFRRDGAIIVIAGTVFFTAAGFAQRFAFLIGLMIFVFTTGYWMAYAQKVVAASAQGDDDPPTWPEFSDFAQDILAPFFQGCAVVVVYIVPFFLALGFIEESWLKYITAGSLLAVGLFMMPMAWLAVSMHESVAALSPHYVIPSILRIPGTYLAVVVELAVLVAIRLGLDELLDRLRIPVLGPLISAFLGIYFMMVICRLLGVLYYRNRTKLAWF